MPQRTAQAPNSTPIKDGADAQSPNKTKVEEELMQILPTFEARHKELSSRHDRTQQSAVASPLNNQNEADSSTVGSSPRGRPKSPPGFVASNLKGFKSPYSPSTPQRRKEVRSLDTNRFSLRQEQQRDNQHQKLLSSSERYPRSQSVERSRSPITPRKIMDAFGRLSDSKHSSPGRLSTTRAPMRGNVVPASAFRPIQTLAPSPTDMESKLIAPQPSKLNAEHHLDTDDYVSSDIENGSVSSKGNDKSSVDGREMSARRTTVGVKSEPTTLPHDTKEPEFGTSPSANGKDSKIESNEGDEPKAQLHSIMLAEQKVEDEPEPKLAQTIDNDSALADRVPKMTKQNESIAESKKTSAPAMSAEDIKGRREAKGSVSESDGKQSNVPEKKRVEYQQREAQKENDSGTDSVEAEADRLKEDYFPENTDGREGFEGVRQPGDIDSESLPKNSGIDDFPAQDVERVVTDRHEEASYENLLDAIVQVQQNDESYEEITVESIPELAQQKTRRANRRPKSVSMVRMNSGISQVTVPDFVTDEEDRIERCLKKARGERSTLQRLLADKETEVEMLLKRKEELQQERLRSNEEYDRVVSSENFDDGAQFSPHQNPDEEPSVAKIITQAEREWEEAKLRRLKFLGAMIQKKKDEVRRLSAQEAEIQQLDAKAMEFELERKATPDVVGIVLDQDQKEIRQWENARAKRSSSLRQRLDHKNQEIRHLSEQENEVRNLAAIAGDPKISSISSEIDLQDIESLIGGTSTQDEAMLWKRAKLRRLEMLIGSLDQKNEELIFLEKQKEELGLSFETNFVEDENSDNWEKKRLVRLETLYGHLERKNEELRKLNDEDGEDFVSTQSLADSRSADKGDDDAWEQAKRRHLKTLHEHIERKNEELRLLEMEANESGNKTPLPEDGPVDGSTRPENGKQWRDVRLQRRKILLKDLERKNQELALLRGQLQGVTRGQLEVGEQVVSKAKSDGLQIDTYSYISSADERMSEMVSRSNETNMSTQAVAEMQSITKGWAEED